VVTPILRTSAGDTRQRDRDPVLDLDLGNIEVGAELEGHVNWKRPSPVEFEVM